MKLTRQRTKGLKPADVSSAQRSTLTRWVQSGLTPQRVALRARIVLMAASGASNSVVARSLEINRHTVALWRRRFAEGGPESLLRDRAGRGRKRKSGSV